MTPDDVAHILVRTIKAHGRALDVRIEEIIHEALNTILKDRLKDG